MTRSSLVLLAVALGCSQPLTVIVAPDADAPDAGQAPTPTGAHCALVEGASFVDLGVPLTAEASLPAQSNVIAVHDGVVAAAGFGSVHVLTAGDWRPLSTTGLPPPGLGWEAQIQTIAFHDGTWWVGMQGSPPPSVRRYVDEATGWEGAGTPGVATGGLAGVVELIPSGDRLLAHTQGNLFVLEPPSTWRPIDFGGAPLEEVVQSDGVVYAIMRGADGESIIQRSADLATWATVPWQRGVVEPPMELAAGSGIVIATPGHVESFGYYRLDPATDTLVAVPVPEHTPPVWIADDGTAMSVQRVDAFNSQAVFAPGLGEPWAVPSGLVPETDGVSLFALRWRIASEGSAIFVPEVLGHTTPFGVPFANVMRLQRSDDHGRSFHPAVTARRPARIVEATTDGETYVVRGLGDLDAIHTVALTDDGAWVDVTESFPNRAVDGVSGVELGAHGELVTRPSERSQETPQLSSDGATTWQALDADFPAYSTDISWAVRRVSAYAVDAAGRLYAATVGGLTDEGYRPGSGVWRWVGDHWQPVNAGIPIAAPGTFFNPAPFRSDVLSIARTSLGMLAYFDGLGVYGLRGDRWHPSDTVGLPLDLAPTLAALENTAIAWGDGRLFVLEGGVWLERDAGTELTSVAARHDLLVRAAREGVAVSADRGQTWTAVEGVERPVILTLSRDRLFATDDAQHVHSIAIRCTEET